MVPSEVTTPVISACTLNNALNVVQLAVLLAILKWVRGPARELSRSIGRPRE